MKAMRIGGMDQSMGQAVVILSMTKSEEGKKSGSRHFRRYSFTQSRVSIELMRSMALEAVFLHELDMVTTMPLNQSKKISQYFAPHSDLCQQSCPRNEFPIKQRCAEIEFAMFTTWDLTCCTVIIVETSYYVTEL